MDKIVIGLCTEFTPNVRAVAQVLSGKPPTDPAHEAWVSYAKDCVRPGLDYFQRQLDTSFKRSLEVFKGCRLFSPSIVHTMQPNAPAVDQALSKVPFLNSMQQLNELKA